MATEVSAVCGGVTVSKQPKSRNLLKPSENLKTSQNLENIQENNIEEGSPVKIPCQKLLDFNHNSIYSRTQVEKMQKKTFTLPLAAGDIALVFGVSAVLWLCVRVL